jgi:hypothetical protein
MSFLSLICLLFPKLSEPFFKEFSSLLPSLTTRKNNRLFPEIQIEEARIDLVTAKFCFDKQDSFSVPIENITSQQKESFYKYKAISLKELQDRIGKDFCKSIDHVGFNLPWFEKSVHPTILDIRQKLKDKCLYYLYPAGENWDFIIPGFKEEILQNKKIDYALTRKPKFEIVSFDICSTPLIQFDIGLFYKYEELVKIFPEAIHVDELRNMWVYLKNPFGIDACLVLNEEKHDDWSGFFKKSRMI